MNNKNINIAELFAGVGGFRVGFERVNSNIFKTVYANQFEPKTKSQDAFNIYIRNFGKDKSTNKYKAKTNKWFYENEDIVKVNEKLNKNPNYIPFNIDMVVGGFPCQDYSVATTKSKGIEGKKGILWWEIEKFISIKKPNFILLENVDRLLISPKNQRGRDFLIMLNVLNNHNYNVEWRIINAANYGYPQSRKRVFIFAWKNVNFKNDEKLKKINDLYISENENKTILTSGKLKVEKVKTTEKEKKTNKDISYVSSNENFNFENYGTMIKGNIRTIKIKVPSEILKKITPIESILEKNVETKFHLKEEQKNKIEQLKNGGKTERIINNFKYFYSAGKMVLHDNRNFTKPARTMLTSESTINRSTHIIKFLDEFKKETYRFITPIEAEKLNGFNVNWTEKGIFNYEEEYEILERRRYFLMGNALVTNLIEDIAQNIINCLK